MIKLMQGDCLERMNEIPDGSVDMVLTDPPYGIDFQSNRVGKEWRKPKIANDKQPFLGFISELKRLLPLPSIHRLQMSYCSRSPFQ